MAGSTHRLAFLIYVGVGAWLLASGWLALTVYREVRADTAHQLADLQVTLVSQAARAISEHIDHLMSDLDLLSRDEQVIAVNPAGARSMQRFFEASRGEFQSVTRTGPDGRILFTWPNSLSIGTSIREQPHVRRLLATHRAVLSDVFTSVQGYRSLAIHVPVTRGGVFDGSVAVLVPVDWIAERFVAGVRITAADNAWVLTANGTEIYSTRPARRAGRDAADQDPGERAVRQAMTDGGSGTATLRYDPATGAPGGVQVAFLPVKLADSHWSIGLATPENQVLSMMSGFLRSWGAAVLLGVAGVGALLVLAFRLVVDAERRRTDEEMERRYRTTVENLPVIHYVVETRPPGRTLYISPQVRHILGFTPEQWIADPELWRRQIHPDDRERVEEAVRSNDSRIEPTEIEYRVLTSDGRVRWIHNRSTFTRTGGELTITGVMLDVTERRHAEEALQQRDEQLAQAQKMEAIGRLAGGVAHDFNNLLTVINGHADLLLSDLRIPEAAQANVREIAEAGQRARRLTDQLLAYSRKQIHSPQVLDLADAVRRMQTMLRRLIGEHIDLVTDLPPEEAAVRIDPGQLEQVIMNLCVNARDSMTDGGTLYVSVSRSEPDPGSAEERPAPPDGAWVALRVKDTGAGMDAETLSHVFEPFFTTKGKGKGTGLGLSTVYGIVAQAGGHVSAQSTPGAGATFEVLLPAADNGASSPSDRSVADVGSARVEEPGTNRRPPGSPPGAGFVVLLVEDEKRVRDLTASLLEGAGYTVLTAPNGQEALEVHANAVRPVDLLLTDVIMPGMGGAELARRLLAIQPGLSVIYITGYAGEELGTQGELAEGINLVQKPFSRAELLQRIAQVLTESGAPR